MNDNKAVMQDALQEIEAYWWKVDSEWGPTEGGLDGAILRGEEPVITRLRAAIAQPEQPEQPAGSDALMRLKFFRDLSDDERFKVLNVFGVVPEGVTASDMNHNVERRLLDKALQAIAQPEQPAAAWRERAIFLIYYDDQDQRPEILIGEAVGRARFKTVGMSWNAHLFVKVASNSHDDSYANNNAPMFYDTIAQPVQPAERNFCARCGKRLFSDGIHTCTPPKSTK